VALTTTGRTPNGNLTGSPTTTRTRLGPAVATAILAGRPDGRAARAAAAALAGSPPIDASLGRLASGALREDLVARQADDPDHRQGDGDQQRDRGGQLNRGRPDVGFETAPGRADAQRAGHRSPDPEERPDMVENAVEQLGDGALPGPRQGERRDGGGDGSYQTLAVIALSVLRCRSQL
jgi:hypothetical protein